MLYEIEPMVTIDPDRKPRAYEQAVQRIAGLVEKHLTLPGVPSAIDSDGIMIYFTTLTPLLEEQRAWLRNTPEIHGFCLNAVGGGNLTLAQQRPTTQTYPCIFSSPTDSTTRLEIIIGLNGLTSYLHIKGGKGIKLANDQELLEQLLQADIPLVGWKQTVWLCYRCGQPGARDAHAMCAACDAAHQMFMSIPFVEGLEQAGSLTSATIGRFRAEYNNQELRLTWPGIQVLCDLAESQHLLHFLLAVLPFGGKQNEALLQALDLQATRRLLETVAPAYRIEHEADQVVLIQQNDERYALAAWVLLEGNRERAVKAVLAAEGDYTPSSAQEQLALRELFDTLEAPEDED